MEIINLKMDYNKRGYLGECFANGYMAKYGFIGTLSDLRISRNLNEEHKKYLKLHGGTIDGYKLKAISTQRSAIWSNDHGYFEYQIAVVYEIKTRWEDTKSKKHYLTKHSMKAYEEAIKLDIPVKLVIVTFYNNFDIKVEDVDFHKKHFKIC